MTTRLCGARYRHNRALTCGKQPGHLGTDPLHKFVPDDKASIEWFDHDSEPPGRTTVPDLLGALQHAVDAARAARKDGVEVGFPNHTATCPWVTHDEPCTCGATDRLQRRLNTPAGAEVRDA